MRPTLLIPTAILYSTLSAATSSAAEAGQRMAAIDAQSVNMSELHPIPGEKPAAKTPTTKPLF